MMLQYYCAKALLYALLCLLGFLVIVGQKKPQSMATAFILIPVCMLLYWMQKRLWLRANQRMPLVCVQATLVNHRQVFEGPWMSIYKKSFLTFELESGEQIEFEVSREEFDRIKIGAKGPLEYRGRLYVSFRKLAH